MPRSALPSVIRSSFVPTTYNYRAVGFVFVGHSLAPTTTHLTLGLGVGQLGNPQFDLFKALLVAQIETNQSRFGCAIVDAAKRSEVSARQERTRRKARAASTTRHAERRINAPHALVAFGAGSIPNAQCNRRAVDVDLTCAVRVGALDVSAADWQQGKTQSDAGEQLASTETNRTEIA